MKPSITSLALLASTLLVAPCCAEDITITDWNVTEYETFDDDSNTTYFEYKGVMGDSITWTGEGVNETYLFKDEDDYELCDFTNATLVDGGVFESWPEGTSWKKAVKGSRYFGRNDGSEDCAKIEINFKNKGAALKGGKKECSDSQTGLIEEVTTKGGYGKCKKACMKTRECKTVEAIKAKGTLTCTLYSDEAVEFGSKNKRARCFTLKY